MAKIHADDRSGWEREVELHELGPLQLPPSAPHAKLGQGYGVGNGGVEMQIRRGFGGIKQAEHGGILGELLLPFLLQVTREDCGGDRRKCSALNIDVIINQIAIQAMVLRNASLVTNKKENITN